MSTVRPTDVNTTCLQSVSQAYKHYAIQTHPSSLTLERNDFIHPPSIAGGSVMFSGRPSAVCLFSGVTGGGGETGTGVGADRPG